MYHIKIHSSVNGHLGCFCVLAIVNSAAMNFEVPVSFWIMVFSGYSGEGNGTLLQYSCLENPMDGGAGWAAVHGVAKSRTWLSDFTFTFHFHALEKEMATHSSVLAWRIPRTGEPGGLPSMGSHRVGHDRSDLAAAAAPGYSCLENPMDREAWQATVHGVAESQTWLSDFTSGYMLRSGIAGIFFYVNEVTPGP